MSFIEYKLPLVERQAAVVASGAGLVEATERQK
jgi:hypothetical protein